MHDIAGIASLYRMQDWDIRLTSSDDNTGDACGETEIRRPYRQAVITVYPAKIEDTRDTYGTTTEMVLHHELMEIVCEEHIGCVPEEFRMTPWMIEFCDRLSEHMAGVVWGIINDKEND